MNCDQPADIFLTNEDIPLVTPVTKAPGPWVSPAYGFFTRSATPVPMLRISPVGLPRISRDPTTMPTRQRSQSVNTGECGGSMEGIRLMECNTVMRRKISQIVFSE